MKSSDYLYELLRKHEGSICDSYYIDRKRYCIAAVPPTGGNPWMSVVCGVRYQNLSSVAQPFNTDEEAWEDFLSRNHPELMAKWMAREAEGA